MFAVRNTSLVESVLPLDGPFDASNKAMGITTKALAEATAAEKYPTIEVTIPKPYIEYDRPVYVTYKAHRSVSGVAGTDFKAHGAFWLMKNTTSASNIEVNGSASANAASWSVVDKAMTFSTNQDLVNNLKFEYNINAIDKSKTTVYVDDLAVVPGYAVVYNNAGTVYAKDYVGVIDANGTPEVTSVTVRADGPATGGKFVGWSKKQDGTVADIVTTVEIGGNADVNLYPVYEYSSKFPCVFYDFETGKQGWTYWGVWSITEGAGTVIVERTDSSSGSGAFVTPSSFSVDASKAKYLYMRVKTSTLSSLKAYFKRTEDSAISEDRTLSIPLNPSVGGYQEVYVPITHDLWAGTIASLTINGAVGQAVIDEIGFYEELPYTKWDWNDGTTQGWSCGDRITIEATGTELKVTRTEEGGGGSFSSVMNFKKGEVPYLKLTYKNTSSSNELKVYWRALQTDGYNEDNTFKIPLKTKTDGYVTDVIDLSTLDKADAFLASDIYSCMMAIYKSDGDLFLDEMEFTTKLPKVEVDPLIKEYTFDADGDFESWTDGGAVTAVWENKGLSITRGEGTSGAIYTPSNWAFDTKYARYAVFTLKNTSTNSSMRIYYTSEAHPSYNETTTLALTMPTSMTKYQHFVVDLTQMTDWDGKKWMIAIWPNDGTLYIDRVAIYSEYNAEEEEEIPDVYDITLNASATEITTEGGTVTVTPTVVTDIEGAKTTVSYKTNNSNVAVEKNENGSVTLTGKINGETILTAVSDHDPKYNESITISVSGQTPKTAYYDINVFMLGNSILNHGPHAEWPQGPQAGETGFGMAATKRENDYAHRFNQVYMAQKYGVTDFKAVNFAAFEREIVAENSKDYTQGTGYIAVMNSLKSMTNAPELITIQMGENVSVSGLTANQYENAVTQLIAGLREIVPNAQIVVCTPFWGGPAKVKGMEQTAEKLGLKIVHMDTLNTRENMAYETAPGACQTHPGDLGMDRMAQLLYDQVNLALTENMQPEYVLIPTEMEIWSDDGDTIKTENGSIQMVAAVDPEGAGDAVKWSVDNENIATVDDNGLVTAVNNGTVTVTAISRLDGSITATYEITVSGQTPCYTVTYNAGTTDTVTNLPQSFIYAKNNYALSMNAPERKYYIFEGWSLTEGGKAVDTITVTKDTDVYAVWRKATSWTFDIDGYFEGVTTKAGFNVKAENGVFQALATDTNLETGDVLNIFSPELNIDSSEVAQFVINVQNTAKADDTKFKLIVKTTNGDVTFEKDVTTTEATSYTFDLEGVTGTITGFTLVPTNVDCAVVIDQMGFVGTVANVVSYNANTTDTVTGVPASAIALSEKYTVSTAVPKREGYRFVGWGASATSILPLDTITVTAPTTLYAIWDMAAHWDFSLESEHVKLYTHNGLTLGDLHIADGKLYYDSTNNTDPQIAVNETLKLDATKHKTIEFRVKHSKASSVGSDIFWTTNNDSQWHENKKYSKTLPVSDEYTVASGDIPSSKSTWADTINDIRFDPIHGGAEYWVDYYRIVEADAESVFVIKEGMVEKASEIPYSNVLVDGGTLVADGNCTLTNLAIASGNVDLTGGTIKINGTLEVAEDMPYVCAALRKLSGSDFAYFSGENSIYKNVEAGNFLVKITGDRVYLTDNAGYNATALYSIDRSGKWSSISGGSQNKVIAAKNTAQIRTTGVAGIRFMADVSNSLKLLDDTTEFGETKEIGFVIGLSTVFTDTIPTLKEVETGKAVKGIAYNGTINTVFATESDYETIACVLKGIPMTKEALMTPIIMVPYVTINNGTSDETVYGQSVTNSPYNVALAISQAGGESYAQNKAYIDEILSICA